MNKNILIVLAGGFVIAILVALLVQAGLSGGKKKTVKDSSGEMVRIVVAAKNLSTGDELKPGTLRYQEWPVAALFKGAIKVQKGKNPIDLIEGTLRRDIAMGEPVMKSALAPKSNGNYVAASLKPGMRAYAIKMKPEDVAGGFVKPGDRVDVLLTYKTSVKYRGDNNYIKDMIEANIDKLATETVLQNVPVIAVGQDIDRGDDEDGKKAKKSTKSMIITLEVSKRQAEVMAMSDKVGDISLTLRKMGDDSVTPTEPATTDARVTHVYDEVLEKVYRMEKKTSQDGNIVRIYNGVNIQEVSVGQ